MGKNLNFTYNGLLGVVFGGLLEFLLLRGFGCNCICLLLLLLF